MRKVRIELAIVKEAKKRADFEVIKEITDAFSRSEIIIPWCDKIIKIFKVELEENQENSYKKILIH